MFHLTYLLETSENWSFSDVFRGYRSGTLFENGLNIFFVYLYRLAKLNKYSYLIQKRYQV